METGRTTTPQAAPLTDEEIARDLVTLRRKAGHGVVTASYALRLCATITALQSQLAEAEKAGVEMVRAADRHFATAVENHARAERAEAALKQAPSGLGLTEATARLVKLAQTSAPHGAFIDRPMRTLIDILPSDFLDLAKTITRLTSAKEAGWRTMDSAPRDGTWVLAVFARGSTLWIVQWDGQRKAWTNCDDYIFADAPTHWMLLPSPPKKDETR